MKQSFRSKLNLSLRLSLFACAMAATAAAVSTNSCAASIDKIQTVIVIYGENRSFNNLYGMFPGADGIGNALRSGAYKQTDMDGNELATLPPVRDEETRKIDTTYPPALPNMPFRIDAAPINLGLAIKARVLVDRFFQKQMQINGGKNDHFAAISNAGALAMGYYDGSSLPMWKLAQQYTLADHFFMGAFGGSFLNHQWLACACTPIYKDGPDKLRAKLGEQGNLLKKVSSPATINDGSPSFQDAALTPDGYGINTLQPPYQPSEIAPAGDPALADPEKNPLPPQTQTTIGDTLSEKNISWKWYSGGWNRALKDRKQIYGGEVDFQPHHQPFNYFLRFAPGTKDRAEHLKDSTDLLADIKAGRLPQVSFYKPQGKLNQHPGYADVQSGDGHIAGIIKKLQASPQWKNMLIIVTYDENGGFWDHVAPPKADRWGPGNRIPAIIVSPYAKRGYVDHTTYDTTSILKFLTTRFDLKPLPGVREAVGNLTGALID